MEWTDEFEPTSQINGNIEITFNSKNKEFDFYEPIQEQLVLTVGKTGRANRLTFDAPTSEELLETAETLRKLGEQVKEVEELAKDEEKFDADNISTGVPSEEELEIKEMISEDKGVKQKEVIEEVDFSINKAEEVIENLKRNGELYEPEEGKLQRI